jgi:hypothetical protein
LKKSLIDLLFKVPGRMSFWSGIKLLVVSMTENLIVICCDSIYHNQTK